MKDAGKQGRSVGEWAQAVMSPSPLPNRFFGGPKYHLACPKRPSQKYLYEKKTWVYIKELLCRNSIFSSEINDEM